MPQQVGLQSGATANNSTSNTLDNLGNQTSSLDDGVSEGQGDGPGFLRAALSPTSKRWQIFTTFDYGSLHLANGVTGIRSDTYAEGLGTLYRVSPHFALGGSVGNLHSRGIFANGGGAIHADGIAMAAFGVASWGNTFVDLAYGATLIDSKVNRNSPTVQAAGRADSTVHSIAFKLGHNLRYGRWVTGPRVGLDYSHWSQKGYTESGTGAPLLSVPHLNTESLVTRVEWHASYDITTRFGKVVPRAHLGWHRETMGGRPGGNYTIVGGGTALVTTGVSRIRHYMVAGAGVSMDLGANWKASADYVGQFLNDAFQIHNVSVMLSYGF